MDNGAVVAVVEQWRHVEHRVEHLVEHLLATHEVDESLRVVEHRPCVVPSVALGEGVAPLQRRERLLELAVLQTTAHEVGLLVEHVAVVERALAERLKLLLRLAQLLAELVYAPVVVSVLECASHVLVNLHVVRHVAQLVVVFVAETTSRRNRRVNSLCAMHNSLPELLGVVVLQSAEVSVSHDRRRIVAHHAAAMTRRSPLGQESALLVCVHKARLHLLVHRRIHHVEQREETAEGVPEAGVGEHIAGQHLAVVRRIVNDFALRVLLVERAREEHRAVEARIERAEVVDVQRLHLYLAQHVVPCLASTSLHSVEIVVAKLLEVLYSLLLRDERRGDAHVELLAALCLEAYDGSGVVALAHQFATLYLAVNDYGCICERTVELHHEVVLEVLGHAAVVLCRIAHNHVLLGQHLNVRPIVVSVNDEARLLSLGIRNAHDGSALGRCNLSNDIVVGKIGTIVIRCSHLCLVREPRRALILVEHGRAYLWHHGKLTVVVNPRTRLVGLLEAAQLVGRIGVCPAVAHLSGLRCPEVHAPRHGYGRIGITRRKRVLRLRSDKRADVVDRLVGLGSACTHGSECEHGCE